MTISSTTNRVSYTGNGVTTAFAFGYYFLADADLVVIERVTATGVETTKTLTTHYTVAGAADPAGGTVTMLTAPASTVELIIYRDPAIKQETDLVNNDPLPVETAVERPLDKLTMICQRLADRISRALRLTDGDTSGATTTIVPSASALIGWNSGATALENKTVASIGAVVLSDATPTALTETGAAGTSATVSRADHKHAVGTAFTQTLFDAANAAAARTTLDAQEDVLTTIGDTIVATTAGAAARLPTSASVAAHATTSDVWAARETILTGGAVTFADIADAPYVGAVAWVYQNAAHVWTDGAVFDVQGGANYTAAIGDWVRINAVTVSTFDVTVFKADGAAVVGGPFSTSAEVKTGTETAKSIAPDALLAAIGFSARYNSGNQTITTAGTLTLAHGLGREPILVMCWLKCLTAEAGFSVGDKAAAPPHDLSSSFGASIVADSTNLTIRFANNATVYALLNKTTGNNAPLTNANWALVVEAFA